MTPEMTIVGTREIMTRFQSSLLFFVMTILIFIGLHFLLVTSVSTGPNTNLSLGCLELRRHGFDWTIEGFDPRGLTAVAVISVLATWGLSKTLRHPPGPKDFS